MGVPLFWCKSQGDVWSDFFAVDLAHKAFDKVSGVYVIWSGGDKPVSVCVGFGPIRERLTEHRLDRKFEAYRFNKLFVTWAAIGRIQAEGVALYLAYSIKPIIPPPQSKAKMLEANFPHQPLPASAPKVPPDMQPGQAWEDLMTEGSALDVSVKAAPAPPPPPPPPPPAPKTVPIPVPKPAPKPVPTPAPKELSALQKKFNDFMSAKPAAPTGFFGGGQKKNQEEEENKRVIPVVQMVFEEAVRSRTSDIHIEPLEECTRVRFRIDGLLEEQLIVLKEHDIRLVSRIRVMCNLDPEKDLGVAKPEDARMRITVDKADVDLRLSTFPTAHGEKAVLRLIPRDTKIPRLEDLGLDSEMVKDIDRLIHRPQGMIVVTGPAGNGKSTTLYTILKKLNDPTQNIVTLEDPIELKVKGITQSAIAPKVGFTFASGLRSILRQDPNIVMVGEIRDTETAEIAMSASLTGHLLFTTLHTNSALGAVARLMDMGLELYLISSALTGVIAQRLARRICEKCREAYAPTPAELQQLDEILKRSSLPPVGGQIKQLFRAKGCPACRGSGVSGRILIMEIVHLTPILRQMILRQAALGDLQNMAIKEGMKPMIVDGIRKARMGLLTITEMVRVVGIAD